MIDNVKYLEKLVHFLYFLFFPRFFNISRRPDEEVFPGRIMLILSLKIGIIHILLTHKGGGDGSNQMRMIACEGEERWFKVAYVCKKIFGPQNLKTFLFLYKRRYYIDIYYFV